MKLPISDIKIGERQRQETGDLGPLMESIKKYGLINPIVVYDLDHELQSGFRRLSACKALGMTEIEVRIYGQQLSPFDQQVVELDENICRKDITWQEKALALRKMYLLRKSEGGFVMKKMSECYGINWGHLSAMLSVADALVETEGQDSDFSKGLRECTAIRPAYEFMLSQREKEARAELDRRNALKPQVVVEPGSSPLCNSKEVGKKEASTGPTMVIYDNVTNVIPADTAVCGFGPLPLENLHMRFFLWCRSLNEFLEMKNYYHENKPLAFPIIWNRTNGITWQDCPFSLNYWLGLFVTNGFKKPEEQPFLSSVINCPVPKDSTDIPVPVMQHILDAMCNDDDAVYLPGDNVPAIAVAKCGRVPVFDGTLPGNQGLRMLLRAFYEETIPNVTVI